MFRVIICLAILVPSFLFLIFSAWLSWSSDSLQRSIKHTSIESLNEHVEYPILVIDPIKDFLAKTRDQTNISSDILLENLQVYLNRNPLDTDAWLVGSKIHQQSGNIKSASLYLSVAHSLSETNTPALLRVFNRYLELNLIDQAMPVAKNIAIAKPHEFRRLFYLMSRLSDNDVLVVDKMIPKKPPQKRVRSQPSEISNIYYEWAILDSIRTQNTLLAKEVWKVIPSHEKANSLVGVKFLNYLSQFQKLEFFESVWEEVVSNPLSPESLLNYNGAVNTPCWQIKPNRNVEVMVSEGDNASTLLEVNFLGGANINYNHLSCLIPVNPKKKYKFSGKYRSENISTLSGAFVEIGFPGVKRRIGRSQEIIGNSSWRRFNINFDVPDDIYIIEAKVRRNATKLLDSKISGTVWFDSFELTSIE